MSDVEHWLAANDRYLAIAVDWVRARLERLAAPKSSVVAGPDVALRPEIVDPVKSSPSPSLMGRMFGTWHETKAGATMLPPPVTDRAADKSKGELADTIAVPAAMIEAEAAEHPPALILLGRRLGLTDFERETLLLCAATELDTRIGPLCARAQDDPARPYPTFALALTLFDAAAWDVLSPERPLRYWRLIEINQPAAQPLITSALRVDERIVNYVKGLNYVDDRLAPLLAAMTAALGVLPASQAAIVDAIGRRLTLAHESGRLPVMQLLGSDGESKRTIAQAAAARAGLSLYMLRGDAVPTATADNESLVRLWQRESALLPVALYVDARDLDHAGNGLPAAIRRLVGRNLGVVFMDTREPWPELDRDSVALAVSKPTAKEQQSAWADALGDAADQHPAHLAGHFDLNVATIASIAASARALGAGGDGALSEALWSECLRHARPALDRLAHPIDTKARWEDLELPPVETALLHQVAEQVRRRISVYDEWGFRSRMNRGLGISVLFAGESGTGKTMAAEVLANELRLLLYRIDLSAVVSKYIGETEKNLRTLFDAAENGGAILFFDEADALFGKRSEVKDSHDRYANIEINYLLQRMEAYRGLAILATNMKSALDGAFLRRLRFVVNFPFPGSAERTAIWRKAFPPETPLDHLDYDRLARLNVTGGSINTIAINAAFLAAQAGSAVTMPLVLDAARTEYRKLDHPIAEAEFRHLAPAMATP